MALRNHAERFPQKSKKPRRAAGAAPRKGQTRVSSVNGSPSSKFLFACGARTCHFPSLRCSEWSGWRRVCVFPRHPESRLSGRLWHRPRGPAAYSLPLTYLKILRARRLCWLECRPELRNHGAGWMRAVERLRNGGVPRHPVFLMPATHCTLSVRFFDAPCSAPPKSWLVVARGASARLQLREGVEDVECRAL